MRVARLQGWTEQEMLAQSFEWILLIAADHLLEAEAHQAPAEPPAATPPPVPGRKRVTRTTTFQAA